MCLLGELLLLATEHEHRRSAASDGTERTQHSPQADAFIAGLDAIAEVHSLSTVHQVVVGSNDITRLSTTLIQSLEHHERMVLQLGCVELERNIHSPVGGLGRKGRGSRYQIPLIVLEGNTGILIHQRTNQHVGLAHSQAGVVDGVHDFHVLASHGVLLVLAVEGGSRRDARTGIGLQRSGQHR